MGTTGRSARAIIIGCWAGSAALAAGLGGCGVPADPPTAGGVPMEPVASPEVLVTGAGLSGANGMHFGPDGLLYVASVMGSELVALNPDTGEVESRLTGVQGVHGPDDVAFAPDGAFYWTSILTGEVAGYTAAGERVVAGNPGPGVNPITFSDDGRLFVAQCFLGDGLFELDPAGQEPPRSIADDLGPGCGLNGMDWGSDGRLYGPRWFRGEVVSFDVDSGERRLEAEGLEVPAAVKFDPQGRLHVLDTARGQVLRLGEGEPVVVASLPPGLDNIAFDADGRLFVSSYTDGFVVRVDDEGTVTELSPGGMAHPGGVALFDAPGAAPQVVVADMHALRGYHPGTGEAMLAERNIVGVGEIGGVMAVAADGGHLILTSFTDNSVRIWDPARRHMVARYDDLAAPVSAIRYQGRVVVAEHGKGRVVALDEAGEETLTEGLPAPTGLATDGHRLLVSDRERGEILEIARAGAPVEARVVAAGLAAPEGIALTAAGIVVVEGESGRVLRVDESGGLTLLAMVAPGTPPASPQQPPSMIFNGVAALGEDLYVTGETNRVLYRIRPGAPAAAVQ